VSAAAARPLVFATRNRGKLVELRELLRGVAVLSIDEAAARIGRAIPEVVEDATTFAGNAAKKAREVSQATGLPALADDSGLEVDALGGAPGVSSARYAGEHAGDAANNAKLIAALAGVPAEQRTARFRASLALADLTGPLGDHVLAAEGTCEGTILDAPRGTGGFGYDPLFFAPELGKTFAEAGVGTKSELSHRARAMRAMKPRLLDYLAQLAGTIAIGGLAHIGIRVHSLERSVKFYELLGFTKTAGPIGPEPVAVLDHPSGVELNLILNGASADEPNILMDLPGKHAGITHIALLCPDLEAARERLAAAGIPVSGGPIQFGPRARGMVIRDPDRNVIELHERK
jgi:XTP/dITP diphosphohydrolase